jgi:hypothetical protein
VTSKRMRMLLCLYAFLLGQFADRLIEDIAVGRFSPVLTGLDFEGIKQSKSVTAKIDRGSYFSQLLLFLGCGVLRRRSRRCFSYGNR